MAQLLDILEFKPDNFLVAPKEEWRIMSIGSSKKAGTQPRYCAANCEDYLKDKDQKCGRFYECTKLVFDMHKIDNGESMILIMFATETDPPYDGLAWWVSEAQLVETMGRLPNGHIDIELGKKIVSAMLKEFHALTNPPSEGILIT
jgi:hypothetical protein